MPRFGLSLAYAAALGPAVAAAGAAGCSDEPAPAGARIVLDVPNAALDPSGYTTVDITLHEAAGDTVRSVAIDASGRFDLGDMDPKAAVAIEAVLRSDNGAAVGYGRTAAAAAIAEDAAIVVPVRRPIVYIAGLNYSGAPPNWFGVPATFSDLSVGGALDGMTRAAQKPVLMVSAGPALFAIEQAAASPSGTLVGDATIRGVSTGDHALTGALPGALSGAVQDGAGSDDGGTLVIGTSTALYVVDARPGAAQPARTVAAGSFSRVAIVAGPDGALGAVAIKSRVVTTGTCTPTAELWWIADLGGEVVDARRIAVGGFADVASDGGRAWYVDACRGELGEASATGVRAVRADLVKPTALAVSNGQAWIGVERAAPVTLAVVVVPVEGDAVAPRTLWSEAQEQILAASMFPSVQRRLTAQSSVFQHLEIGAGEEFVAVSTSGAFAGAAVPAANFPEMDIVTEELRVFDAATGGVIQRYRSWCDGTYSVIPSDIQDWRCATTTGQSAAATFQLEHRIASMTFVFGKK